MTVKIRWMNRRKERRVENEKSEVQRGERMWEIREVINREVKWFRKRWREGRAAFFSFCIQSSPVSLPLNWGKQGLPWLLGNALTYCADVLSSLVLMYPCWFKSNHLPAFLCELVRSPETSSVWLSSCSSPAHSPMVISSGNKPVDSPLQKTSSCNPSAQH